MPKDKEDQRGSAILVIFFEYLAKKPLATEMSEH